MAHSRCIWLDVAKGITIILMVLGHTSIPEFASRFIWAFHMPLFFIASGWTTNWEKKSMLKFSRHKFRTIMVPFLIYSTIVLAIEQIAMGGGQYSRIGLKKDGKVMLCGLYLFCS